jgi:hypothetical protein
LLCEPLETTANGKRLVVEDSAACQKTIQSPVAQQVLKTDGAGNLTWTNGANNTVLGKDSTGKVEFVASVNNILQSGPVDLGSQPLTTTGAVTAKTVSITNPSATTALTINQSLAGNGVEINSVDGIPLSIQSTNTNPVNGGTLQFFTASGDMEFNGASDGIFVFRNTSSATTKATSFNGSNVGIGTNSPKESLHVNGEIINETNDFIGSNLYNDGVAFRYLNNGIAGAIKFADAAGIIRIIIAPNNTSGPDATASVITAISINPTGNVGIGTNAPDTEAILDLSSTTKGFLPPRMTTVQRDAIPTPPEGLVIYNTTTNVLNFHNGTAWAAV